MSQLISELEEMLENAKSEEDIRLSKEDVEKIVELLKYLTS